MGLNASVAGKRSLPGFQLTCRNSYCTLKIVELKMAAAAGGVPFCVRLFETVVLVGFASAAAAYGAIWGSGLYMKTSGSRPQAEHTVDSHVKGGGFHFLSTKTLYEPASG